MAKSAGDLAKAAPKKEAAAAKIKLLRLNSILHRPKKELRRPVVKNRRRRTDTENSAGCDGVDRPANRHECAVLITRPVMRERRRGTGNETGGGGDGAAGRQIVEMLQTKLVLTGSARTQVNIIY